MEKGTYFAQWFCLQFAECTSYGADVQQALPLCQSSNMHCCTEPA